MSNIEFCSMSTLKAVKARSEVSQEFVVKGKGRKTQRLLAALKKRGNIEERTWVEYTMVRISTDDLIRALFESRGEVMRHWNKEGQRLIIGSSTLAKLMNTKEINQYAQFRVDARKINRHGDYIMGLEVTVVPWMEGMVILPD